VDAYLWMELAAFVALLGLSAFFSSSETALFSLNSVHLEQMRRERNPRSNLIDHLLAEPRRLIITILIGNELVNVAASVLSASVVIKLLGADQKWVNLLVMIPILLVVGEITPKTLAIRANVAFAAFQSRPIEVFARTITPLRWAVRLVADWFITLIVGTERSRGNIITGDMVKTLAREAVGEGVLDRFEALLIEHIFEFGSASVSEVMIPRSDIFFLPVGMSRPEVIAELRRTWQTKIPVYEDNRDRVIGILHARDLLAPGAPPADDAGEAPEVPLREPYFVPASKPVTDLFQAFRERRQSIALVVDEFGGVIGLITMEDLLECIFGEIHSPSEVRREKRIDRIAEGRFRASGRMRVADFNSSSGVALPTEGAETLGGLLLGVHGELPGAGTSIELMGCSFRVLEVAENQIKFVECQLCTPSQPQADGRESGQPDVVD